MQKGDLYEVLGVPKDASKADIRKAFKKKALKTHPDRPGGSKEQHQQLVRAKLVLEDDASRARYDATGEEQEAGPDPVEKSFMQLVRELLARTDIQQDDMVKVGLKVVDDTLKEQHNAVLKMQKEVKNLEKKRGRFVTLVPGAQNAFEDVIAGAVAEIQQRIASQQELMEICKKVRERLQQYRDAAAVDFKKGGGNWPGGGQRQGPVK